MPDFIVRDIDPETYDRMRKAAKAQGKSLSQMVREALVRTYKPSKKEVWAEIDAFRERVGPVSGDSTADIREWRDNADPHR